MDKQRLLSVPCEVCHGNGKVQGFLFKRVCLCCEGKGYRMQTFEVIEDVWNFPLLTNDLLTTSEAKELERETPSQVG